MNALRTFWARRRLLLLVLVPTLALAAAVDQGQPSGTRSAWFTSNAAQVGGLTTEVLVLNATQTALPSAAGVPLVSTALSGRRAIEIQNLGPNAIFCAVGPASTPPSAVLTKSRRIEAATATSTDKWAIDLNDRVVVRCLAAVADQVTGAATIVTELR